MVGDPPYPYGYPPYWPQQQIYWNPPGCVCPPTSEQTSSARASRCDRGLRRRHPPAVRRALRSRPAAEQRQRQRQRAVLKRRDPRCLTLIVRCVIDA